MTVQEGLPDIQVHIVEDGEPRTRYPFTAIPPSPVPSIGDIVMLPTSLAASVAEAQDALPGVPFRVVDRTYVYADYLGPTRVRNTLLHVRLMTLSEYNDTPK